MTSEMTRIRSFEDRTTTTESIDRDQGARSVKRLRLFSQRGVLQSEALKLAR